VTRPLVIIFLTIFVNLVGFGIIIPLLPYYAETFGASPVVVGLLFAVFSLCQLVAAPVLGDLSDRYGRRPVLVFSLAGTVVSFVMLAVAHSVAMLFAARIVDGLSGGNISTARAYVADVTEPKDRAKNFRLSGAAVGIGMILGPLLSGWLVDASRNPAFPFFTAGALGLLNALFLALFLPETNRQPKATHVHPDYARQGLGRRLIATVADWARARGARALTLMTFDDVPWHGSYYARLGFRTLHLMALSPGLQAVRQGEAEAGLPMEHRICMQLDL